MLPSAFGLPLVEADLPKAFVHSSLVVLYSATNCVHYLAVVGYALGYVLELADCDEVVHQSTKAGDANLA